GDVANGFIAVLGQTDLGDLTQSRVGLLRGRGVNAGANAATLGRTFQSRDLVTGRLGLARLADQLVDRRHTISSLFDMEACAFRPGRLMSLLLDRAEAPPGFCFQVSRNSQTKKPERALWAFRRAQ